MKAVKEILYKHKKTTGLAALLLFCYMFYNLALRDTLSVIQESKHLSAQIDTLKSKLRTIAVTSTVKSKQQNMQNISIKSNSGRDELTGIIAAEALNNQVDLLSLTNETKGTMSGTTIYSNRFELSGDFKSLLTLANTIEHRLPENLRIPSLKFWLQKNKQNSKQLALHAVLVIESIKTN